MQQKNLFSESRVWTARADETISQCVGLMRDKGVGALVILSDDKHEEIVGIFTERDLLRDFELIQQGGFWQSPVRTVMTSKVRTITVAELQEAPKIMCEHNIRHLPVVREEKGRKRLIGVISMRDLFRYVMEGFDFHLGKVYRQTETVKPKREKKLVAIFSSDPAIMELVDKGAKLTKHMLVRAAPLKAEFDNFNEILQRFDSLFVDLDDLKGVELAKVLAAAKSVAVGDVLFLTFNLNKFPKDKLDELHALATRKRVHLLSKPVALGLLYERFLREI